MKTSTLNIRNGDTLSYSGVVTLPAGNWRAACALRDPRDGQFYSVSIEMTRVGPNAQDATRNDWVVRLFASSVDTSSPSAWPQAKYGEALQIITAIIFSDDQTPPTVKTSGYFLVEINPKLTP